MQADGSRPINLTNHPDPDDSNPIWSPDGRLIAFNSNRSGASQVWLMSADGSDPRQVPTGIACSYYGNFSPDAATIVFRGDVERGSEIFKISITGAGVQQLTRRASK
jgi:TolB protein